MKTKKKTVKYGWRIFEIKKMVIYKLVLYRELSSIHVCECKNVLETFRFLPFYLPCCTNNLSLLGHFESKFEPFNCCSAKN